MSTKIYKRRFVTLFLLYMSLLLSSYHATEYTSMTTTATNYYNVSAPTVAFTATVYNLIFAIFAPFLFKFIEFFGLGTSIVMAATLQSIGASIKCFTISPHTFYVVFIAQSFLALSKALILIKYSTVVAVWCSVKESALMKALVASAVNLGISLTFIQENLLSAGNFKQNLTNLTLFLAIVSFIMALLSMLLVEEKPKTPPSLAEKHKSIERNWKQLLCNRDYLLLVIAFTMALIVYNAVTVVANQAVLSVIPKGEDTVTIMGLSIHLAGIFAPSFGLILDRTKSFKLCANIFYAFTMLFIVTLGIGFQILSLPLIYISSGLYGLCSAGFLLAAPDMVLEITYPFCEYRAISFLRFFANVFGFVVPPFASSLISNFGPSAAFIVFITLQLLGLVFMLCMKWELRRQSVEETRPLLGYENNFKLPKAP